MRTRCPSRRVRARLFFLFCSGLVAPATQAAIVVNGRLDEPEWRDAVQYRDFRVVAPYLLSPAPDSAGTVGYLLSTPDGLVVGFTLTQSDDYPRIRPRQDTRADRVAAMIDFDSSGCFRRKSPVTKKDAAIFLSAQTFRIVGTPSA